MPSDETQDPFYMQSTDGLYAERIISAASINSYLMQPLILTTSTSRCKSVTVFARRTS